MENPDTASTREEVIPEEEKSSDDKDSLAANTGSEESKSASDRVAAGNDNSTDNTNPVDETMKEAGEVAEPETGDTGTTDVKPEENKEAQESSTEEMKDSAPVKKEDGEVSSGDPSAEEEKETPPSTGEPSATTDNEPKSEPSSPKGDAMDVEKDTEPTADPTAAENQDDKKPDSKSPEPVVKEDTTSMEVESSASNEPEPSGEESVKTSTETSNANATTTTYSTRGRSTEAAAVEEKPERVHIRDTFEESPRPKDPQPGASFLVEAMTEEERRTRTRFLPDVDGMTMLRKSEIKDDLALASSLPSIVSPSGLETRTGRLGNASGRSNDSMDVDGNDVNLAINDEITTTIKLPSSDLTVPSDVFVAPQGVVVGDTDTSIEVKEFEPPVQSPSVVESVMSFNPPRPPESVGGKKKHRMIRWERRPEDIEVDMKNYRRTVQRTRQELQKSESQYERLEMIDIHLRHHFMNHSKLLGQEYANLQDELEVEVEKLMEESDLVGSRTRSRNLTKVDVVMRDVLTMLTRNEQKDVEMDGVAKEEPVSNDFYPGIGGLNAQAFSDWERSTEFESLSPCVSWIEPGQRVTTPYGEGTVIEIFPPESPPANDMAADDGKKSDVKNQKGNKAKSKNMQDYNKYDSLLPLRVKVRLEYGVGIFVASSILKMESPAHFTDAKLAKRWKGMIDSALAVGPCVDLQGMIPKTETSGGAIPSQENNEVSSTDATKKSSDDFLRVGASLIPTKFGRGNFLHDMSIPDIEETLQNVLYDGHGVLGRVS